MTTPAPAAAGPRPTPAVRGVELLGTGSALPARRLTNVDLEKMMDTSDEWIVQRTGIRERRIINREAGESAHSLSADALRAALTDAKIGPEELDLVIVATMTAEMTCPPTSCRVIDSVGAANAGAFDLSAACCGFVFAINTAHDLIKCGGYRTIAVIGCDTLSINMDYTTEGRSTAIIFGDAAGAAIFRACDDAGKGILAQSMHADGGGWKDIYVPRCAHDFPSGTEPDAAKHGFVQMNGAQVFKFAVGTFPELIAETLAKAAIAADKVDMYVCHQSNARILQAARDRFGLPADKLYINIDRYGNTVAASVPLCLDELRRAGRVQAGQRVMFVAFGGGLTWGSSLWQL
ncbi:MAG: ketoacyl-ACP synthase III [Phycisphaeraceae bacterium]|nr:ketoacyl-ACP synthase III [Phycisphaeraceae bacterium]